MATHKLFVYGTLRTGEGQVAFLQGRLHNFGHFPGITKGNDRIRGEIREVISDAQLKEFDRYEGFADKPDDLYKREKTWVTLEDGTRVETWVYWFNRTVPANSYIAPVDGYSEWH